MAINVTYVGFNYLDADIVAEIQKNVNTLLATPEGTVAGDRSFGINQDFVGMPRYVAENQLALEVMEKLDIYEPRAIVKNVDYDTDADGSLKAMFLIGANDDYEEEYETEDDVEEE